MTKQVPEPVTRHNSGAKVGIIIIKTKFKIMKYFLNCRLLTCGAKADSGPSHFRRSMTSRMTSEASVMPKTAVMCIMAPFVTTFPYDMAPLPSARREASG